MSRTGVERIAVIANGASGSSVDEETLRAAWAQEGIEPDWLPTTKESPGTEQAARAAADGVDTVVACGGDGTVRAVLEGLAGTDVALGIVPLGTGNLLAGNLGLPSGIDAVPVASRGSTRRIDVGTINGERFAVMAGVGLDAAVVGEANDALKRRVGALAYVLSAVRQVRSLRSKMFRVHVVTDGDSWMGRTVLVLIGNCGTVSGGLEVFPDARPDDGLLDVAVVTATGLRQWASVVGRMLASRPQRSDLVQRMRAKEVTVHLDRAMPYELDGEVRDPVRHLQISVEHHALAVRVGVADETVGDTDGQMTST